MWQSKFFGNDHVELDKILRKFYKENRLNFKLQMLEQVIHPRSIIGKKLIFKYPSKTLKLL